MSKLSGARAQHHASPQRQVALQRQVPEKSLHENDRLHANICEQPVSVCQQIKNSLSSRQNTTPLRVHFEAFTFCVHTQIQQHVG